MAAGLITAFAGHSASQEILWTNSFGGDGRDYGHSIRSTPDSGYILVGYSYSFDPQEPVLYIVRLDSEGEVKWNRTYQGVASNHPGWTRFDIQYMNDGGFVVCGAAPDTSGSRDAYVLKIDSTGDSLWARMFGGDGLDIARSVEATADGGCIICGLSNSFGDGDYDVYVIKLDSLGNHEWSETYGGVGDESGMSIRQLLNFGYIVAGSSKTEYWYSRVYLVKTDPYGHEIWSRWLGEDSVSGSSVAVTSNGDFVVVGSRHYRDFPWKHAYSLKVTSDGIPVWSHVYELFISSFWEVHADDAGCFYLGGQANEYYWLKGLVMKVDSLGDKVWEKGFQMNNNHSTFVAGIDIGHLRFDSSIVTVGTYWHYDSIPENYNIFVAKLKDSTYTGPLLQTLDLPDTVYAADANTVGRVLVSVYIGDFMDGHTVYDIDSTTVLINSFIVPEALLILPSHPEFTGEVMRVSFPLREFVLSYGWLFDTTIQVYTVSGQFADETPFSVQRQFTYIGHISGDLNLDGRVNIADLALMVAYLFEGAALTEPAAADLDQDDNVTVSDLTVLVGMLF